MVALVIDSGGFMGWCLCAMSRIESDMEDQRDGKH